MSLLLSDYALFSGIYLSDPAATSLKNIRQEMEGILKLETKRLESRLEDTLKEIESLPACKIGVYALQGLIRGAYFAACALKTRSRILKKQTTLRTVQDKLQKVVEACGQLQEDLSRHPDAPQCVKIARFSHRPFRKVVEGMAHGRDHGLVNGSLMELKDSHSRKAASVLAPAAYLPL